jgi:hypothetical protein
VVRKTLVSTKAGAASMQAKPKGEWGSLVPWNQVPSFNPFGMANIQYCKTLHEAYYRATLLHSDQKGSMPRYDRTGCQDRTTCYERMRRIIERGLPPTKRG